MKKNEDEILKLGHNEVAIQRIAALNETMRDILYIEGLRANAKDFTMVAFYDKILSDMREGRFKTMLMRDWETQFQGW